MSVVRDPTCHPEPRDASGTAPFRAALQRSGVALLAFALAAVWVVWRHRGALESANLSVVAALPLGIVAVCFVHAYASALVGARRADVIVRATLVVVMVGGLYWLTRYLEGRYY